MAKKRKRTKQSSATASNRPHQSSDNNQARVENTAASAAQHKAHTAAQPAGLLDNVLFALAIVGILLTVYLTFTAWFGDHPAFCGADSGCDLVQSSRWSTLLGIPMSLWGLLTYAVLARSIWRLRSRPSAWRFALLVAFVGVGVSWFLTIVSVVQIEATCMYCLASFGIINAILILLLIRRPTHLPEHAWSKALPTPASIAAVVVVALSLHFSGLLDPAAGPEDPWLKGLAMHLSERGALFYGAYWCPNCEEQKNIFEASVKRLPYVECTPDGRNGPVSMACRDADISGYPTWVIGEKRVTGVVQPDELARLSGFRRR